MSKFISTKNKPKTIWSKTQDNDVSSSKLVKLTIKISPAIFKKNIIEIPILKKYLVDGPVILIPC